MFQMTFGIITPVIALGGPADRMKFSAAMVFVSLWLIFAYAPIAHMVWGPGGYLAGAGVLDFAGGTVVHINSAIAGLVAAIVVGKRKGLGTEQMAPHNVALTMIGGSLLWVGWFGFNVGSVLSAGTATGITMINTHLATVAALVSWTLVEWILKGKPSLLGAISGAIAGLWRSPLLAALSQSTALSSSASQRASSATGASPASSICSAMTTRWTSGAFTVSAASSAPS